VATIQGQRASSLLPPADTPCRAESLPARSHADELAQSAWSAWRSLTPSVADPASASGRMLALDVGRQAAEPGQLPGRLSGWGVISRA
jgi:hypothetical protein